MEQDNYLLPDSLIPDIDPKEVFNVNVGTPLSPGIMGHVDSGKTSLCKLMTKIASTAALDKSQQSQDRGITLDLGFSAFFSKMPADLRGTRLAHPSEDRPQVQVPPVHAGRLSGPRQPHEDHHRQRLHHRHDPPGHRHQQGHRGAVVLP